MTESGTTPSSDLPVRAISAVVMITVAGLALRLGGSVWTLFVCGVSGGILIEWSNLVRAFVPGLAGRLAWHVAAAIYVGLALYALLVLRLIYGPVAVVIAVGTIVAVDVLAYAFGRVIGGPKIAPAISPSKTWSGLLGGVIGAALVLFAAHRWDWRFALAGVPVAIVAQAGDFFESWMKRRAGVKDSGALIPGHGGLFDRCDGLIAVMSLIGASLLLAGLAR